MTSTLHINARRHWHGTAREQRGVSTLLIVMLLFFVVSLASAYAGRNLVFEQRTSVNQLRSTESFEAAEAGMEWAIAMLNGGLVDDSCRPDVTATTTFRQRNIVINSTTGVVNRLAGTGAGGYRWSACVFDGTNWNCSCKNDGSPPALTTPTGPGTFPAFGVRFFQQLTAPGVVRVEVNGCNQYDLPGCISRIAPGAPGVCHATLCSMLALQSGLKLTPNSAVTLKGNLDGTELTVFNTEARSGGVTVYAGGAISVANLKGAGPNNTPVGTTTQPGDPDLAALPVDDPECRRCMFASVFGLWPESYRQQPATVRMDCNAACSASAVRTLVAANPGRMLYLSGAGGLRLDSSGDIGSAAVPVVLAVEGPVESTSAGAVVYGIVYASDASLTDGTIRGALVSATDVTGSGPAQVVYEKAVLDLLHLTQGSFVRIPGSWRDFQ